MKTFTLHDAINTVLVNKQTIVSAAKHGNPHPMVYVRGTCVKLDIMYGLCHQVHALIIAMNVPRFCVDTALDEQLTTLGYVSKDYPVSHPSMADYEAYRVATMAEFWDDSEHEYAANRWDLINRLHTNTLPL